MWLCKCECGNTITVSTHQLNSGNTRSCGCLQKEAAANNGRKAKSTHGLSKQNGKNTRLFRIWLGIKTRCYNKNVPEYARYGGRGIKLCEEWHSFPVFCQWAYSAGYSETLSIDRINNNGDYCPQNCRWATAKEQANNRRNNRKIEYEGRTYTLTQLSQLLGTSPQALHAKLKRQQNK